MKSIELLIVEDCENELAACRDSIERYQNQRQLLIELTPCQSVEDAFSSLNNSFDAAIIDLKLGEDGNEGFRITRKIEEQNLRIPIAILTGTPDLVDTDNAYIGIYKKGESNAAYEKLFDMFFEIYDTGLTRIMGNRGKIEEHLTKVFEKNLLPQLKTWKKYGKDNSPKTEKALLRYTLNHMLRLLDEDTDEFFPEEVYLFPPLISRIHTGSIVEDKNLKEALSFYMVMNPACDLIVRCNGEPKADRILLVKIEQEQGIVDQAVSEIKNTGKKRSRLKQVFGNNFTDYYHWLPRTDFFPGGFVNFRHICTFSKEKFDQQFKEPTIQISPSYVKDIVARFSGFYARQGQPDIKSDASVEKYNTIDI